MIMFEKELSILELSEEKKNAVRAWQNWSEQYGIKIKSLTAYGNKGYELTFENGFVINSDEDEEDYYDNEDYYDDVDETNYNPYTAQNEYDYEQPEDF